ncbi:MAG: HNH endonuclease [Actinomycetota bacterium]
MAIKLSITDEQKKVIKERFASDGNIECQVCGKGLKFVEETEYHFICPTLETKSDDTRNIAPLCKKHKSAVKNLSIKEYKALREMEDFFGKKRARKLNDVLREKLGESSFGQAVQVKFNERGMNLDIRLGQKEQCLPVSVCPSTGYHYFYIVLPARYINNDLELQPRPLEMKRMWELYRHLMLHSQLTPSICRLVDSRIMLFDGQHKTAAQVWAGRDEIECKVYIDPQVKVLKETNLVAHDKLRQMPFFSSVLINKWADLFSEQWQEYLDTGGMKSEAGFVSFLVKRGRKRAEALNMVISNIYDSILEDEGNRFSKYISEYSQSASLLTLGKLKQSIFKKFIAKPPLKINIEESDRLREHERKNVVKLLNILAETTTANGGHKTDNIYLNGALKAWSTLLRDTIAQILGLYDDSERKKIFLRNISMEDWDIIGDKIGKLFEHRLWSDSSERTIESLKNSREDEVMDFLKSRGLNVNWILSDSGTRVNVNNFID